MVGQDGAFDADTQVRSRSLILAWVYLIPFLCKQTRRIK
jgi:hypothetical protein